MPIVNYGTPFETTENCTLKHIKSVASAIFKLAKQQDYFQGENPARDTAINPTAAEPKETYAYSLDEIESVLEILPEAVATIDQRVAGGGRFARVPAGV
jgi:hypothetical protein